MGGDAPAWLKAVRNAFLPEKQSSVRRTIQIADIQSSGGSWEQLFVGHFLSSRRGRRKYRFCCRGSS